MAMRTALQIMIGSLGLMTSVGTAAVVISGHGGAGQSATAAATSSAEIKNRFVGTWKLVSVEQLNAAGQLVPPAASQASGKPPLGIIIYDAAGYVAVTIMPGERHKYAAAQPTDEEAKEAL